MEEPTNIPVKSTENPAAAANQLTLLLNASTATVEEEFKRTERLDAKARNQATATAALFAGAQALVVGLFNGLLTRGEHPSAFVPYLAALGAVATGAVLLAFLASYGAWRLREEDAVDVGAITGPLYLESAAAGNPRVGINLVKYYARIAEERGAVTDRRVRSLAAATKWCVATTIVVSAELVLAFVAVAVQ